MWSRERHTWGAFQVVFVSSLILRFHASRTFAVLVVGALARGFGSGCRVDVRGMERGWVGRSQSMLGPLE